VFQDGCTMFMGKIIGMPEDFIVDPYITMSISNGMCDALDAKYGVSNIGSELYVME
jgi:hypothetical protein